MLKSLFLFVFFILGNTAFADLTLGPGVFQSADATTTCVLRVNQLDDTHILIKWVDNGPDKSCETAYSADYVRSSGTNRFFKNGESTLDGLEVVDSKSFRLGFVTPILYTYFADKYIPGTLFHGHDEEGWYFSKNTMCDIGSGTTQYCEQIQKWEITGDLHTCDQSTAKALSNATADCVAKYGNSMHCDLESTTNDVQLLRPENSTNDFFFTGCVSDVSVRAK